MRRQSDKDALFVHADVFIDNYQRLTLLISLWGYPADFVLHMAILSNSMLSSPGGNLFI